MDPIMIAGLGCFFAGGLTFMAVVFGSGGARKSEQLRVIGEVWRGQHGGAKRRALRLALLGVGLGAILCFAGVSRGDARRAARCRDFCVSQGHEAGAIGAASTVAGKKPAYVACKCSGGSRPPREVRADDLAE